MKTKIAAVLFDLDGTLVDTAPDLATALNIVLQQQGYAPLPFQQIRPWCSEGSKGLLNLGLQLDEQHPDFLQRRADFLQAYHEHLHDQTIIFPTMAEVLHYLAAQQLPWGVVTNKPFALAEQLLQALGLRRDCVCLVGGDSLTRRKPDPEPLFHACAAIGCEPAACIYIGDAERDVIAAKRAGMYAIAALYGYRTPEDQPEQWQADFYIQTPHDIIAWLKAQL